MKIVTNVYALGFVSYEGRGRRDLVGVDDHVKKEPEGSGRGQSRCEERGQRDPVGVEDGKILLCV